MYQRIDKINALLRQEISSIILQEISDPRVSFTVSVVNVGTTTTTASEGSSSAISVVGIASTYRSAKILVSIGETNQIYNPRIE